MKHIQSLKGLNVNKYYIVTKPTQISDISFDDFEAEDYGWQDKARRLQARRWRKIKQQLA